MVANKKKKISELFNFLPKSKIKAGEGIENGKYSFYTCSNELTKYYNEYTFEPNKLIFGTGGSASLHYASEPFATSTDCYVIEAKELNVDVKYVYYYLKNNFQILEDGFKGAGLKHISKDYLSNIMIEYPDIEDQKRIVKILDKAQEIRIKKKLANEKLDEFLKSTFIDMFGDPVTNSNNFTTKKLIELCINIFGGGTPSKQNSKYYIGDIPWVTPKDMKTKLIKNSIDHINQIAIENSSAKLIPPNSLLMVIRSGILKRTLPLGINVVPVAINQDMKAFVLNENIINCRFLYYALKLMEIPILKNVRSVTADNIEFNLIKNLTIICPDIILQNQFAQIVQKVEAQKENNQKVIEQMDNLFNSLMQQAFNK